MHAGGLRHFVGVAGQQNRSVQRGQERTPPSLDTLVTYEYRRSYQSLVTGFIATLPAAAEARAARLKLLEDAFQAELAGVAGPSGTPAIPNLAYYPRLSVLAQTIRTASYAVGVTTPADRADAALLRAFGQDTRLVAQTAEQRQQWGYAPPAKPAAAAADAGRPMDTVDYLRAVGLALMHNDQDAALVAYRAWAKFGGLPKPPMFIGTIQLADRSPGIPEVAQHAFQRLDARHFGSLAQYIRDLADQDVYAEKLILDLVYQYETIDVPILTRLEKEIGQPLIAEDRLMRLINKRENWMELNLQYVLTHLSLDRQIDVLLRYAKANDIPLLSLYELGYTSIGCEPCTTLPMDPNNPRSGRWQGEKLECGIHIEAK